MGQPNSHSFTLKSNGGLLRTLITPVMASVPGNMPMDGFKGIWDTGATGTVITQAVVDRLNLVPIGMTKVNTASELNVDTYQYVIDVFLKNNVKISNVLVTLGKLIDNVHFLIGMDIITIGDFSVTNHKGTTCMSFRVPSGHEIDYTKNPLMGVQKDSGAQISKNAPCPCGSGKLYKRCHGVGL